MKAGAHPKNSTRHWGIWKRTLMGLGLAAATAVRAQDSMSTPAPAQFGGKARAFTQSGKYVVGTYVANWSSASIVDHMDGSSVTHVLYAFVRICGPGQSEMEATSCAHHPDFTLASNHVDDEFGEAFQRLKVRSPHVKVLVSIGGWAGSDPFFHIASDSRRRAIFAASVADFLRAHSAFDGIDIDWEYPTDNGSATGAKLGSPADGEGYADLVASLRLELNELARATGRHYLLTTAVGTSRKLVEKINYKRADQYLDYVFMMTYDFYNGQTGAGNHSSLRAHAVDSDDGLDAAVTSFVRAGVPSSKLVAGVAMYGHGFTGVAEPPRGASFNGTKKAGNWPLPDGSIGYREICARYLDSDGHGRSGFKTLFDSRTQAWNLYSPKKHQLLGYDDPRAVVAKGAYVQQHDLAGLFAWEYSQDNGDILAAMNAGVGNEERH